MYTLAPTERVHVDSRHMNITFTDNLDADPARIAAQAFQHIPGAHYIRALTTNGTRVVGVGAAAGYRVKLHEAIKAHYNKDVHPDYTVDGWDIYILITGAPQFTYLTAEPMGVARGFPYVLPGILKHCHTYTQLKGVMQAIGGTMIRAGTLSVDPADYIPYGTDNLVEVELIVGYTVDTEALFKCERPPHLHCTKEKEGKCDTDCVLFPKHANGMPRKRLINRVQAPITQRMTVPHSSLFASSKPGNKVRAYGVTFHGGIPEDLASSWLPMDRKNNTVFIPVDAVLSEAYLGVSHLVIPISTRTEK